MSARKPASPMQQPPRTPPCTPPQPSVPVPSHPSPHTPRFAAASAASAASSALPPTHTAYSPHATYSPHAVYSHPSHLPTSMGNQVIPPGVSLPTTYMAPTTSYPAPHTMTYHYVAPVASPASTYYIPGHTVPYSPAAPPAVSPYTSPHLRTPAPSPYAVAPVAPMHNPYQHVHAGHPHPYPHSMPTTPKTPLLAPSPALEPNRGTVPGIPSRRRHRVATALYAPGYHPTKKHSWDSSLQPLRGILKRTSTQNKGMAQRAWPNVPEMPKPPRWYQPAFTPYLPARSPTVEFEWEDEDAFALPTAVAEMGGGDARGQGWTTSRRNRTDNVMHPNAEDVAEKRRSKLKELESEVNWLRAREAERFARGQESAARRLMREDELARRWAHQELMVRQSKERERRRGRDQERERAKEGERAHRHYNPYAR